MGCESFDVVRLHLGLLLQGQIRVAKLKSAFSLLINEKCCLSSKTMLVGLCQWIHPASGHRCVLGLVSLEKLQTALLKLLSVFHYITHHQFLCL